MDESRMYGARMKKPRIKLRVRKGRADEKSVGWMLYGLADRHPFFSSFAESSGNRELIPLELTKAPTSDTRKRGREPTENWSRNSPNSIVGNLKRENGWHSPRILESRARQIARKTNRAHAISAHGNSIFRYLGCCAELTVRFTPARLRPI